MTESANANFGIFGDGGGNDEGGNDGGKRELSIAAPMVIVLVAKVVIRFVIVIAAFVIGVSVMMCGTVVVFLVVSVIPTLINSSIPCTMVIVKFRSCMIT